MITAMDNTGRAAAGDAATPRAATPPAGGAADRPDRPARELPRRDSGSDRQGERGAGRRSGEPVPEPSALGRRGRAAPRRAPGAAERGRAVGRPGDDPARRWYSSTGMPPAS